MSTQSQVSPLTICSNVLSIGTSQDNQTAFSPPSIATLLAFCHLGARNETRKQMSKVLGFDDDESTHASLHMYCDIVKKDSALSNFFAFYVKNSYELDNKFVGKLSQFGDFRNVDFNEKDRAELNALVESKTDGMIQDFIADPFDPDLKLLLLNTLLCKVKFQYPFDKDKTQDKPFTKLDGTTVNVPLMFKYCKEYDDYRYSESDKCQIVELFCKDTDCVFGILLPKEGVSPKEVYHLDPMTFTMRVNHEVGLLLPRFTVEQEHDLVPVIKGMGKFQHPCFRHLMDIFR